MDFVSKTSYRTNVSGKVEWNFICSVCVEIVVPIWQILYVLKFSNTDAILFVKDMQFDIIFSTEIWYSIVIHKENQILLLRTLIESDPFFFDLWWKMKPALVLHKKKYLHLFFTITNWTNSPFVCTTPHLWI